MKIKNKKSIPVLWGVVPGKLMTCEAKRHFCTFLCQGC
jgi:hypothetical protein